MNIKGETLVVTTGKNAGTVVAVPVEEKPEELDYERNTNVELSADVSADVCDRRYMGPVCSRPPAAAGALFGSSGRSPDVASSSQIDPQSPLVAPRNVTRR